MVEGIIPDLVKDFLFKHGILTEIYLNKSNMVKFITANLLCYNAWTKQLDNNNAVGVIYFDYSRSIRSYYNKAGPFF